MKQKIWLSLFFMSVILATIPLISEAFDTFRCGTKIISKGDRKYDVLMKCGEPTYASTRYEKRIRRDLFKDLFPPAEQRESEKYREPLFVEEFVEVEEWVYNLGSTHFIRYLTFENGILVELETGDYGY
jgi:hypothetical protein